MTDTLNADTQDTFEPQDDAAFEAEREAARQEQEGDSGLGLGDGADDVPQADPERERLEKLARDKDGMARSERAKRREAEARAQELEARIAALEGKGTPDYLQQAIEIDPNVDPIGALEAQRAALKAEHEARQQQAQQSAQQQQFQAINSRLQSYEADFRADNPDYDEAAVFLRDSKKAEMEAMGYSGAELEKALHDDLVGLAVRSMQSGRDPAEVAYALAKKRGFGVETTKKVDEPDKILQVVQKGQKAAKSLSSAGAKTGDGALTMEAVMKLDGAAFDAALAKLKAQEMGGSSWRN